MKAKTNIRVGVDCGQGGVYVVVNACNGGWYAK